MGYEYLKNSIEDAAKYGYLDEGKELKGEKFDTEISKEFAIPKAEQEYRSTLMSVHDALQEKDEIIDHLDKTVSDLENQLIDLESLVEDMTNDTRNTFSEYSQYKFAFEELVKVLFRYARD